MKVVGSGRMSQGKGGNAARSRLHGLEVPELKHRSTPSSSASAHCTMHPRARINKSGRQFNEPGKVTLARTTRTTMMPRTMSGLLAWLSWFGRLGEGKREMIIERQGFGGRSGQPAHTCHSAGLAGRC